ncbi:MULTISPECIES: hypothetical protein [unclassified Lysobacter]|uniref:hypothetical protein n=1 Tax=unclassified Lysobacter TaxID=2635362 RepID=UPI0007009450|nr:MULTISPECIES: hypothetical protein [unclassified Lysobacter]KQZ56872.1 hypothetical protein ASD53_10265 [Lysobacter sp. Root559]KRC34716.1 hypothetical protein ASE10_08420 [Lysobacter sp. Root76]KRD70404.1 hypothetical protein ASE45_00585 [Lysobacter sp. Root96]
MKTVLVENGQILGSFKGKFAVVGGAVPWLLLAHEDSRMSARSTWTSAWIRKCPATPLRSHRLASPADLTLLIKVCLTLEGFGRTIDPDFDMAPQAQPFLRRAIARQFAPRAIGRSGTRAMADAASLLAVVPRDLKRLLRLLRAGGARMHMQVDELHEFNHGIGRAANRLSGAMAIAAVIVGSSIAMTVEGRPTLLGGLALFGLLGFVSASLAGVWLLWSIFRSGGRR